MMLVNWGCGGDLRDDPWINFDKVDYDERAVVHDITKEPLPLRDGWTDGIVCNHSLQALRYRDVPAALAEFYRVLRPGGVLRVIVPDIEAGFRAYATLDRAWFPNQEQESTAEAFTHWLTWGGDNLTCFTVESLWAALTDAGFSDVERSVIGTTIFEDPIITDLDSRPNESIFMEGIK